MSTASTSDQDAKPAKSHQEAFEFYAALGPGRTYRQVSDRIGVSLATVKRWSKIHSWVSRANEREVQIARQVADRTIESSIEDLERKRKLVKAALIRLGQAIGQGKIKLALSDLDRMIRLDALLNGLPDGVLINGPAFGASSVEELRGYVDMTPTYILDAYADDCERRDRERQAEVEAEQLRHNQAVEEINRQRERDGR